MVLQVVLASVRAQAPAELVVPQVELAFVPVQAQAGQALVLAASVVPQAELAFVPVQVLVGQALALVA